MKASVEPEWSRRWFGRAPAVSIPRSNTRRAYDCMFIDAARWSAVLPEKGFVSRPRLEERFKSCGRTLGWKPAVVQAACIEVLSLEKLSICVNWDWRTNFCDNDPRNDGSFRRTPSRSLLVLVPKLTALMRFPASDAQKAISEPPWGVLMKMTPWILPSRCRYFWSLLQSSNDYATKFSPLLRREAAFQPTCLNNGTPKLWQMNTTRHVRSALLLRTELTRWRKSRAKSSISAEDFEKATVESYPYVNILVSGSCSGRRSWSQSFPLSVQVQNLSPPRSWIAKMLPTC